MASSAARRVLLPRLILTELCADNLPGCMQRTIPKTSWSNSTTYSYQVKTRNIRGENVPCAYNHVPVVLDGVTGAPWRPAVFYLVNLINNAPRVANAIDTAQSTANDLASYKRFLEDENINYEIFPLNSSFRPTYRFRAFLLTQVELGEIGVSTAKRRVGSVVRFYRWLIKKNYINPENAPWEESDVYIEIDGHYGQSKTLKVKTTDLSIKVPTQYDPYSGYIYDEGRLRPLNVREQQVLIEALLATDNVEMKIFHLLAIVTCARIQTILTLRAQQFYALPPSIGGEVRIPVGFGTSTDTKFDKKLILHVPIWLYERIHTYALSDRAKKRRARSGDKDDYYLFITNRGTPYYESKRDRGSFDPKSDAAQSKKGEAVRQFIRDYILPVMRREFGENYSYSPHDLRATGGMNCTNQMLELVKEGKITLQQARDYVRTIMGHSDSKVTDLYLDFGVLCEYFISVRREYDAHLEKLMESVIHAGL